MIYDLGLVLFGSILCSQISGSEGLYCSQCDSTKDEGCTLNSDKLLAKCQDADAIACQTYVGVMAGGSDMVVRGCTRQPMGSFCMPVGPALPGFQHAICLLSCEKPGCNNHSPAHIKLLKKLFL